MFGPISRDRQTSGSYRSGAFYGRTKQGYVLFESGIPETPYLEIRTNGGDAPDVG